MQIAWDICQHIHAMSDIGHNHLAGTCQRFHNNNAECYAQQDGVKCRRRGCCIIARDARTWKKISSKSWELNNLKQVGG